MEDYNIIKELHKLCVSKEVGFTLVFEEGTPTWYVTIDSPAPTERFVSKSRPTIRSAVEDAIEHLNLVV